MHPLFSLEEMMKTVPVDQILFYYYSSCIVNSNVLHLSKIKVIDKIIIWTLVKESKR